MPFTIVSTSFLMLPMLLMLSTSSPHLNALAVQHSTPSLDTLNAPDLISAPSMLLPFSPFPRRSGHSRDVPSTSFFSQPLRRHSPRPFQHLCGLRFSALFPSPSQRHSRCSRCLPTLFFYQPPQQTPHNLSSLSATPYDTSIIHATPGPRFF